MVHESDHFFLCFAFQTSGARRSLWVESKSALPKFISMQCFEHKEHRATNFFAIWNFDIDAINNSPNRTIARGPEIAVVHSPPPLLHITAPGTSPWVWKWQRHSCQSQENHIACKCKPRSSLLVALECVDWGRTILTCQQQRRRRRQSLVVVDSGACKEAQRFWEMLFFHDILEEYSDIEKQSLADNYHPRTLVTLLV